MKDVVNNPEKIEEKKTELQSLIEELKEVYDWYEARIKELLR